MDYGIRGKLFDKIMLLLFLNMSNVHAIVKRWFPQAEHAEEDV